MNDRVEKIRNMCKNLNISDGKTTDEYIFTINAVDLFFYKRNIGEIDIKSGFVDGAYDGGIDFIYSDSDKMYLIQGKSSSSLSFDDIKNLFYKMAETVENFEEKKYDQYSDALKSAYLNAYDYLNDSKNIELVLFTNSFLDENLRKKINEFLDNEILSNYDISAYDNKDIQLKEAVLFQDSDLIEEDSIELSLNKENINNILSYGENGIIVNVKASSLKRLFDKWGNNGLFSYNLREHITQKSVDNGIDNTIKNERDKFWFYNNGITIGCNDFAKDGNRIRLYDFSIINGAQTTTKIGKSKLINDKNDFALVCKIVRAKNSFEVDKDFISKISEASNSQKPIRQRDLKSNAVEQKLLQSKCAANGKHSLAIEIKRGVRAKNYRKVNKWQRVTNEYVGQLIYSCIFQKPGPARNSKNIMFSSSKIYKQIFLRKHDCDTIYDLVRIGNMYDDFASNYIAKNEDLDLIAIAKNGKLTVLAIIIYLCKKERNILNDSTSDLLHKDNIYGLLITDYPYDDLDEKLNNLFTFIIRQLKVLYESKKDSMKITSYSNFFKSEQIYEVILREFDILDDWDKNKLANFMTIFTEKQVVN